MLRCHPHSFFCRRPVYDYTKFLYCPLEVLGLASVADVKFLHVLYFPTVIKDGRFVAVVVYAEERDMKGYKKTEGLVLYLKALAREGVLPIIGKLPASLYFTEQFSIDDMTQYQTDTLFSRRGHTCTNRWSIVMMWR